MKSSQLPVSDDLKLHVFADGRDFVANRIGLVTASDTSEPLARPVD